ncbi:MAG: hypothetical protein RSA98_10165 [Odoribacter sp.]
MITNIIDKNTLKGWFKRGFKPLESQFAAWMDSYWHKSEKIQTSSIEGLETTLNNKAESIALDNLSKDLTLHKDDSTVHKTEEEQNKLNNLASNPNITYATKEELLTQGAIIIPVDFTDPVVDPVETIKKFVQPFIDDGSFFKKPVYANYIWKTSYEVGVVAESRSVLVPARIYQNERNSIEYKFGKALDVLDAYDNMLHKYELLISKSDARIIVSLNDFINDVDKTIFIVENGDNLISLADRDDGMYTKELNWTAFLTALKNKLTPSVYLKTNNTDVFIPASYYLAPNTNGTYDGVIRIEHVKNQQLWIEDRKFLLSSGGGFGGHGSVMETTIQKIPLKKEFNSFVLNLDLMTPEGGLSTQIFKDDVANQFETFDVDIPIIIRLKKMQQADTFGYVDKFLYENDQGMKIFTVDFFVNDAEIAGTLGGDSFRMTCFMQNQQKAVSIFSNGFTFSKTLFLYDNNDGFITAPDNFMSQTNWTKMHSRWSDLCNELKYGRLPSVYIRSIESGAFCPATYEFNPSNVAGIFQGNIEISYYKTIDGKKYLCRENRVFRDFGGEGSTYETVDNGSGKFVLNVEKYLL